MKFWLYTVRALWRIHRGRWYVWRDAPTDVVRKVAALYFAMRKDKEPSCELKALIIDARNETKLRKRRSQL